MPYQTAVNRQLSRYITLQTVDGKTVIVVEVSEGRQRPYYIKALGRDGGVYVRVELPALPTSIW